jgi:hypothetical protein
MSNLPVSEERLWEVESDFEKAFQQLLTQAGIANAYRSREGTEIQTPCVEIAFMLGEATEGYRHILKDINGSPQRPAYAGWKGSQLQFIVTTNRGTNGSQHKVFISKVRMQCQYYNLTRYWPGCTDAIAHAIADIRDKGTSYSLDSDNNFDITTMTFQVMHNLKDAAWPINL